jgi:hypothetical protein
LDNLHFFVLLGIPKEQHSLKAGPLVAGIWKGQNRTLCDLLQKNAKLACHTPLHLCAEWIFLGNAWVVLCILYALLAGNSSALGSWFDWGGCCFLWNWEVKRAENASLLAALVVELMLALLVVTLTMMAAALTVATLAVALAIGRGYIGSPNTLICCFSASPATRIFVLVFMCRPSSCTTNTSHLP